MLFLSHFGRSIKEKQTILKDCFFKIVHCTLFDFYFLLIVFLFFMSWTINLGVVYWYLFSNGARAEGEKSQLTVKYLLPLQLSLFPTYFKCKNQDILTSPPPKYYYTKLQNYSNVMLLLSICICFIRRCPIYQNIFISTIH